MKFENLKKALIADLGRNPSPALRRQIAEELQRLASEQQRLAAAQEQIGHHQAAATDALHNATRRGGRPRGSGGSFVRYELRHDPGGDYLFIAAKLYRAIGSPDRIDGQMIAGQLHLRPALPGDGYAVNIPGGQRGGLPRLSIGRSVAEDWGLAEGRMNAEVRAGAIVILLVRG